MTVAKIIGGRRAWIVASLLGLTAGSPAAAMTLAQDGRATAVIVLGPSEVPAERTAARELAHYLSAITGGEFPVLDPEDPRPSGPTLWVGATAFARHHDIRPEAMGPEHWIVRSVGGDLVLAGGRPRGTLYAVYVYLERYLGVRWWTPFEEHVPWRPTLSHRTIDDEGEPAFRYRDVSGVVGHPVFLARHRINGAMGRIPWDFGGGVDYGPPSGVHNFYRYVPPSQYFEQHPEYFSEIDGRRTTENAQLCLTNEDVQRIVVARLAEYIHQAERESAASRTPPARLFAISQNDWGGPCQCARCRDAVAETGSQSGVVIRFLNGVADLIHDDFPEIELDTLAYHYTLDPPVGALPRDNLVVRLSGLQYRDYSKGIQAPENTRYREAVETWAVRAPKLRIWDYTVTFGMADLPLPNVTYLADDLRFYLDLGIDGLFVQHEHPITADLRDLKLWMLMKLLEDPRRDESALLREFTDGYYGRAGRWVRRYVRLLDRVAARRPTVIRFRAAPPEYGYIDSAFLKRGNRLFERARRTVVDDPILSRRVRHAQLSFDTATLFRWCDLVGQLASGHGALDLESVAERYRRTLHEQIDLRESAASRQSSKQEVDRQLELLLSLARGEKTLVY